MSTVDTIADSAVLVATCQQCRNAMAYLASPSVEADKLARLARRRFDLLPQRHADAHGPGSTADTQTPRCAVPADQRCWCGLGKWHITPHAAQGGDEK